MSSSIELVDSIRSCRYATVDELLNAFNSAAAAASLKDYFGCFASVDSRFLGTDSTENWTASDFYAYTKPHFTIGKGWTYIPRKETRKIDLFYNTQQQQKQPLYAYFDELLDSESFSLSRGTGVCEYDASLNCWFINSYHLTFAIPNGLAKGICSIINKYEQNKIAAAAEAELLLLLDEESSSVGTKKSSNKQGGKKKGK